MDFKYDSSVMNKLTDATEQRMVEAYHCLENIISVSQSISTSDWDDAKRREYVTALEGIQSSLMSSVLSLNEYLVHLRSKMAEFENRG